MPDADDRLWIDYDITASAKPGSHSAAKAFFRVWQILGPLYLDFRERLTRLGLHYRGMAVRRVAERLSVDCDDVDMFLRSGGRFVFAGFGNISRAEIAVMEALYTRQIADFFWDVDLPCFSMEENGAARAVKRLSEKFPAPFALRPPDAVPRISIVGVPSEISQVKEAAEVLSSMNLSGYDASSTAVVLADEVLCVPLLNSLALPPGVDVNITMGYPLRLSPVASAVETFALMHSRARYLRDEGLTTFFRDDVSRLLSHPLLLRLAPDECRGLAKCVEQLRLYNIPSVELQGVAGSLAPLFAPLRDAGTGTGAFAGIRTAVQCLLALFPEPESPAGPSPDGEEVDDAVEDLWILDRSFLHGYLDELDMLEQNILTVLGGKVVYGGTSAMRSVAKIMAGRKVSFSGAPLRGLQVLGIDETRTLDFDRIVAVSMNERVFPRRSQSPTFIPQTLRQAYGLPTAEHKEAETAYAFYRMLSRASEVCLIYNANTEGITSGEMSRYLYQLVYAYRPAGLTSVVKNYKVGVVSREEISLVKSDAAMDEIKRFLPDAPDDQRRSFSASSIKTLLDCEMKFYLKYVAGFNLPDEVRGYIDDSVYGKIVHEVLECIYNHQAYKQGRADKGALITASLLASLKKDPLLDRYIIRAINHVYHGRDGAGIAAASDDLDTPLSGESMLFAALIKKNIVRLLEAEAAWVSDKYEVIYLHGESRDSRTLSLADGLEINFMHIIDRIDRVTDTYGSEPYLRLVDYKTGSEELKASTVAHLVDYSLSKKHPHGITQLMMYCNSYAQWIGHDGRIHPVIYPMREIINSAAVSDLKVGPPKVDPETGKSGRSLPPLTDYREINDEFVTLISAKIRRLLDPSEPIVQTPVPDDCKYCEFREICNR